MKLKWYYILILSVLSGNLHYLLATNDTLKVGLYHDPPFVIHIGDNQFEGLSIELWENIAETSELNYTYELQSDFVEVLKKIEYNEIDVTINPMDVNPIRLKRYEMTQPFSISSIGVAVPYIDRSTLGVFISNIFSYAFLKIIFLLILIIFVFGFFLWLVERNNNKFQFRPGLLGLFDGLWWSAVTMTTVGYGDKAPKTNLGKAIAIIWMFTAVIIISSFTAGIASTLTISSLKTDIKNVEDLRIVENICTVGASNGETYLNRKDIKITNTYSSPLIALRAVAKKENDVLLYDHTVLQYYINKLQLEEKVKLIPLAIKENYQSFMMPKNHSDYDKINSGLIQEIQKEDWLELQRKYNIIGNSL